MAQVDREHLYHHLGRKIDGLQTRTPWNNAFYSLLAALYTPEEAQLLVKMPNGLSTLGRIERITRYDRTELQAMLDRLSAKGLVFDISLRGKYRYMPSPMIIGIFEWVMMRTGDDLPSKEWAKLFTQYMHGDDSFFKANAGHGERVSIIRTLPREQAVLPSVYTEVLDYEKASAIVDESKRFAIGLCSCRHEKALTGEKKCDIPLDICSSFGIGADFMIRHGFAKEVSRTQMKENLARSRELKLVLMADNVKKQPTFFCHCCKCCCNVLLGITQHGCPNVVETSNYVSQVNEDKCTGCGRCVDPCPVNAIEVIAGENKRSKRGKVIRIDADVCIGCGVCRLSCALDGIALVKRKQRVLTPEDTFERVVLMSLERGTLQNQLFDDPSSLTQGALRGIVGAFLRLPPVKQKLMSDQMRSTFLDAMRGGARKQGNLAALVS
jgi:ferredoxin